MWAEFKHASQPPCVPVRCDRKALLFLLSGLACDPREQCPSQDTSLPPVFLSCNKASSCQKHRALHLQKFHSIQKFYRLYVQTEISLLMSGCLYRQLINFNKKAAFFWSRSAFFWFNFKTIYFFWFCLEKLIINLLNQKLTLNLLI